MKRALDQKKTKMTELTQMTLTTKSSRMLNIKVTNHRIKDLDLDKIKNLMH
jgi:hypothetical protein